MFCVSYCKRSDDDPGLSETPHSDDVEKVYSLLPPPRKWKSATDNSNFRFQLGGLPPTPTHPTSWSDNLGLHSACLTRDLALYPFCDRLETMPLCSTFHGRMDGCRSGRNSLTRFPSFLRNTGLLQRYQNSHWHLKMGHFNPFTA